MNRNNENVLGWSQSGTLITGRPNSAVKLQAHFPRRDTYTVQFLVPSLNGEVSADDPPFRNIARPKAIIQWSTAGNTIQRIVDVFQGTSLSGQAESVVVRLFDDNRTPTAPSIRGAVGTPYGATIQCTRGIRGGPLVPSLQAVDYSIGGVPGLSYQSVGIAPGAQANFPIPEGAGAQSFMFQLVSWNGTPLAYPAFQVRTADSIGQGVDVLTTQQGIWLPLSQGATVVEIENNSADGAFAAVYWGIDG